MNNYNLNNNNGNIIIIICINKGWGGEESEELRLEERICGAVAFMGEREREGENEREREILLDNNKLNNYNL